METKKEIAEIVECLETDALPEVLRYLKEIEKKEQHRRVIAAHLEDIIREDPRRTQKTRRLRR